MRRPFRCHPAIDAARRAEWVGETTLRAAGWSGAEIDALGAPVKTIVGARFFRLDDVNAALEARAAPKARKPKLYVRRLMGARKAHLPFSACWRRKTRGHSGGASQCAHESPARIPGGALAGAAQSPAGLRLRDQMRV